MNNFIEKLISKLKEELPSEHIIKCTKITKNNGTESTSIIIKSSTATIYPSIYIDDFFNDYKNGRPIKDIADDILCFYQKQSISDFDIYQFTDFNHVKDKIYFQLINTEKNADLLKDVPNVPYLDFSIIFRVSVNAGPFQEGSFIIHHTHLSMWGVSLHDIYTAAMENTPKLFPWEIKSMANLLTQLAPCLFQEDFSPYDSTMHVLTNTKKINGCSCILYPNVLSDFADKLGCDLYILPSSIHEAILLPYEKESPSKLSEIVKDVNASIVRAEDFLSDNVYHYCRKTKQLNIISS